MGWRSIPCLMKVLIAVMAVIFLFNFPNNSSEWASWVQAFGTLGAIAGAVWVFTKQADIALDQQKADIERNEAELRRERVQKVLAQQRLVTLGAHGIDTFCLETTKDEIQTIDQLNKKIRQQRTGFDLGCEILQSVDLSGYPVILLGLYVVNLRQHANTILQIIEYAEGDSNAEPEQIKTHLLEMRKNIAKVCEAQENFVRDYDGRLELKGAFTLKR